MIRDAKKSDAAAIVRIYNHYVANTIVTFEEELVSEAEMSSRIIQISEKLPWIVYESDHMIAGYAYASEWKSRCAYKNSLETTVYLEQDQTGKGIGSQLYSDLINRLRKMGYHALIGGISLPNQGSVALHEKFGFEKVAQFKEVGHKFDHWIDVGYWELIL